MADKRLDQTTNASAVAAADNIPFVTAAGVTSYVTGDEMAASGPFSSRYAPLPGAWTAWTPTITAQTGTITTVGAVSGRYVQMGKVVHCTFSVVITTKGSAANALILTTPVNASTSPPASAAIGVWREAANTGLTGVVLNSTATEVALRRYDNATPFQTDGDIIRGSFTFEAA